MLAVTAASTVTTTGWLVALQEPSDVVTLYAPAALTVMDWVVAPFDQRYDAAVLEVSVTEPPSQNVVGPLAVTVGVVTVRSGKVMLFVLVQPFFVTCTETTTSPVPSAWKITLLLSYDVEKMVPCWMLQV